MRRYVIDIEYTPPTQMYIRGVHTRNAYPKNTKKKINKKRFLNKNIQTYNIAVWMTLITIIMNEYELKIIITSTGDKYEFCFVTLHSKSANFTNIRWARLHTHTRQAHGSISQFNEMFTVRWGERRQSWQNSIILVSAPKTEKSIAFPPPRSWMTSPLRNARRAICEKKKK